MKKIFYFAALALSVIAFSSCTDKQANGNNNGSDSTATEQEGEAKMGPMGTFTIPEGSALKDAALPKQLCKCNGERRGHQRKDRYLLQQRTC